MSNRNTRMASLLLILLGASLLGGQSRHVVLAQAATLASASTAVSADWPMYRGNPARTGAMPGPRPVGQPVELWHVQLEGEIRSAPAVAGETLYVGGGDGGLYVIDMTTGAERWRFDTGNPISSSPAVADGLVYVGSDDGTLYALEAESGQERWAFPGIRPQASAASVDGTVYAGSEDGFLYAIDGASGEEIWRAALGDAASRSTAVADDRVYIGSADGVLHAVAAASGEEVWHFQAGDGIPATPAIADGTVYQATFEGDANLLYALDAATGEERWTFAAPEGDGFAPPAIGGGTIFIPSHDGYMYALDAATGQQRWRFATGDRVTAAPALVGETLYVGGDDRLLYALDAVTGDERWQLPLEGAVDYGPTVTGGVVYVGTTFGVLYAIGGSGMEQLTTPATVQGTPDAAESAVATRMTGSAATPITETTALELLWQTTGGPEALFAPAGAAVAADGTLWVVDAGNNRIQIFSPEGDFLESWDGTGGGGKAFDFAKTGGGSDGDVAFSPDGTIVVVEAGSLRVQHFAPDRTVIGAWGGFGSGDGQFVRALGLAVDAAGTIYVATIGATTFRSSMPTAPSSSRLAAKAAGKGSSANPATSRSMARVMSWWPTGGTTASSGSRATARS